MLAIQGIYQRYQGLKRRLPGGVPQGLALLILPISMVFAYRLGGEPMLFLAAALGSVVFLFDLKPRPPRPVVRDRLTGLMQADALRQRLSQMLGEDQRSGTRTTCFIIEIEEFHRIGDRLGRAASEQALQVTAQRLRQVLRENDSLARVGEHRFALAITGPGQGDLETCIQLAARLKSATQAAIDIDATALHLCCCVGFCLSSRAPEQTATALIDAATLALQEARRHGPSAIRSYSTDLQIKTNSRQQLSLEAHNALAHRQIHAWFQPQVSTETGKITGFEALARWNHPQCGILLPGAFLTTLEEAGQLTRLTDEMLDQALAALAQWDKLGLHIPNVGVNFACDDLRNPQLVEKIQWKLDQYGLDPPRLTLEILETVVADTPDDMIARNINGMAKLGCRIDLDDFGTGHAAISSIRRFAVSRLKIDRSFVSKSDRDPNQERMVHAIISMAERLGLDTLAEGVETSGEHSILAQLGCNHVQGFGIARPMPLAETFNWIRQHNRKLPNMPEFGRKTG